MHNVGIVVESLDNAISFFAETGLKLEGRLYMGFNSSYRRFRNSFFPLFY